VQGLHCLAICMCPCRWPRVAAQYLWNQSMQIKNPAALALVAAVQGLPANACSVNTGWRPPSVQRAYETAQVVVHGRVVSQTADQVSTVTIDKIKVLKGSFSGNSVENRSPSLCGSELINGVEYVFFFPKGVGYRVSSLTQPAETAAQVLRLLPRDASGSFVPAPVRPSGRYLQEGWRLPARPTTNDPDPSVIVQIDLGSQQLCESRLATVPKDTRRHSSLGGDEAWCTPNSASAKLKYHGRLTTVSNGKSFYIETRSVEWCKEIADQAITAGAAAQKAIELSLECQAR
jgi:hypothetical protein